LVITGAYARSRLLTATIAAGLLGSLCGAPVAAAANPGGTTAGAGGTAAGGGALTPAKSVKTSAATPEATSAHVKSIRIMTVSCIPVSRCSADPHQVSTHGLLVIAGKGVTAGMVVGFPRAPGARITTKSPGSRLRQTSSGLVVTVPDAAHSGHIMILLNHGRYTSSYGPIYVFRHALHPPPAPKPAPAPVPASTAAGSPSAFEGQGMWIWYLSQSDGGNLASIVAQAHASGVTTLFIKSSDGSTNYWTQFSPQLVQELHANGIKVCAWQYVYGTNPAGEAALGAEAVANGADCLVIDAEAEYEGRYSAAQTYISDLRARIGTAYPVGLASFPYVSYHQSFPYSVFLGPNGAQYNAPQMYWKDIGNSVDTVYANTFIANRIYGRPIYPLGQAFGGVSPEELLRFREEATDYGATGISFWDWQESGEAEWGALAAPLTPLTSVTPNTTYPELASGAKGDQVLWLQEHLASAIPAQEISGVFGSQTVTDLSDFQAVHAIPPSGVAEAATWAALLALPPVAVDWTGGGPSA
jgi:peptidoglycan hydrolase-like protein with peptidoglycan-binding domain